MKDIINNPSKYWLLLGITFLAINLFWRIKNKSIQVQNNAMNSAIGTYTSRGGEILFVKDSDHLTHSKISKHTIEHIIHAFWPTLQQLGSEINS